MFFFFFFKQKTAYEMRISDWSSDVCSSDLDDSLAQTKMNWKYRAPFKLTQYWKKEKRTADSSLSVRVNGRARYWSGGTRDVSRYMPIPGGPSFENFELRERNIHGQRFYYGLFSKNPDKWIQ